MCSSAEVILQHSWWVRFSRFWHLRPLSCRHLNQKPVICLVCWCFFTGQPRQSLKDPLHGHTEASLHCGILCFFFTLYVASLRNFLFWHALLLFVYMQAGTFTTSPHLIWFESGRAMVPSEGSERMKHFCPFLAHKAQTRCASDPLILPDLVVLPISK